MSRSRNGYAQIPTEDSDIENNNNDVKLTIYEDNEDSYASSDLSEDSFLTVASHTSSVNNAGPRPELTNDIWMHHIIPFLNNKNRADLAATARKFHELVNSFPIEQISLIEEQWNTVKQASYVQAQEKFFYVHRTKEDKEKILEGKGNLLTHGQVTQFFMMRKNIRNLTKKNNEIADLLTLAVKCPSLSIGFLLYLSLMLTTVMSIPAGSLLLGFATGLVLYKLDVKPNDSGYAALAVFIASMLVIGGTAYRKRNAIFDGAKKCTYDLADKASTEFGRFIHAKMAARSKNEGKKISAGFFEKEKFNLIPYTNLLDLTLRNSTLRKK